MDERSQGAIEYLLMLAAVLVTVSAIIYMIESASSELESEVGSRIENVRDTVVDILT